MNKDDRSIRISKYILTPKRLEKDEQGKGKVHRTQPSTHPSYHSRAPRRYQTKIGGGRREQRNRLSVK
jgi:hypothetical protein